MSASLDAAVASSAFGPAAFALAGSLIGGFIAGTVSLLVARQARDAAEHAWVRDSRRNVYDRFLTKAQRLLIASLACRSVPSVEGAKGAAEAAYAEFFEVNGVLQTVAERPLVETARIYAYRLLRLKETAVGASSFGSSDVSHMGKLVRDARLATIDAMRNELGLTGSVDPGEGYNPYLETRFEDEYAKTYLGTTSSAPA